MTYDFQCKNCNHKFSKEFSWKEYANWKKKCPECKSSKVVQVYSPPTIRFIGGGFYKNDSKGK